VGNHGGRTIVVDTDADFLPDVDAIAAVITEHTRAILLNTPNNPSGRVYPAAVLRDLDGHAVAPAQPAAGHQRRALQAARLRRRQAARRGGPHRNTAICYSWSKPRPWPASASAFSRFPRACPTRPDGRGLRLRQSHARLRERAGAVAKGDGRGGDACVDVGAYEHKRDILCDGLAAAGYDVRKPEGGYYVFLKTPIPDDVAFVGQLAQARRAGRARHRFRPRRLHAAVHDRAHGHHRTLAARLRPRLRRGNGLGAVPSSLRGKGAIGESGARLLRACAGTPPPGTEVNGRADASMTSSGSGWHPLAKLAERLRTSRRERSRPPARRAQVCIDTL
jgi:hypothetical protein